jgi:hypothetical protein
MATVALAAGMSGCVVFKGPIRAKQIGDKPKVAVKFKLCNSDPEPDSTCPGLGNSNDGGSPGGMYTEERVLLGFRVPKGSEMPRRIGARGDVVDGGFEPFRAYARELNAKAPARRGLKWFGYSAHPGGEDGGNDSFRYEEAGFRAVIRLPDGFDEGAFKLRPVAGWTSPTGGPEFDCGPDPFERVVPEGETETDVICIDSPSRAKTRRSIRVPIG